jgi:hypothetical protein
MSALLMRGTALNLILPDSNSVSDRYHGTRVCAHAPNATMHKGRVAKTVLLSLGALVRSLGALFYSRANERRRRNPSTRNLR